jgi:hypothetical protein
VYPRLEQIATAWYVVILGGGEARLSALIHAFAQSAEHTTQGDPVMASMPLVHDAGGTLPPWRHPVPLSRTPPDPPSNTGPAPPAPVVVVVTVKPPSKPQSIGQLNEFSPRWGMQMPSPQNAQSMGQLNGFSLPVQMPSPHLWQTPQSAWQLPQFSPR